MNLRGQASMGPLIAVERPPVKSDDPTDFSNNHPYHRGDSAMPHRNLLARLLGIFVTTGGALAGQGAWAQTAATAPDAGSAAILTL